MTTFSATKFSNVRLGVLGITGVVCLLYGALALILGRPDPITPWLPGGLGLGAAFVIYLSAEAAGRKNARIASDELYVAEWRRSVRIAYWVALWLYPIFALLLYFDLTQYKVAFAAMGTLTGAASLLTFVVLSLRGT